MATLAPAIRLLTTSLALWTPPVIARSALICPAMSATQRSRSRSSLGTLRSRLGTIARFSMSKSGW